MTQSVQSEVAKALLQIETSLSELVFFNGDQDKTVIPVLGQALKEQKFSGGITYFSLLPTVLLTLYFSIQVYDDEITTEDFSTIYKAFDEDVKIRYSFKRFFCNTMVFVDGGLTRTLPSSLFMVVTRLC